jgi:Methyltransferase domain
MDDMLNRIRDLISTGYIPRDVNILKAELQVQHTVRRRRFLLQYLPDKSVGAELGVFTGMYSSLLARDGRIEKITFVDPWWKEFGPQYPDWGGYTDYGRVTTRSAYEVASERIRRSGRNNRFIEVDYSYQWLASQDDGSLDWAYLDSTHSYEGTKRELELLNKKINDTGLILGDDWQISRDHIHHGVLLAVNEFLKTSDFEVILCGFQGQWVLRRSAVKTRLSLTDYQNPAVNVFSAVSTDRKH